MAQVKWTGPRLGKHRVGDVVPCSESAAKFYEKHKFGARIDEATGEIAPAPASPRVRTREMKAEDTAPVVDGSEFKTPSTEEELKKTRRYRRRDMRAEDA